MSVQHRRCVYIEFAELTLSYFIPPRGHLVICHLVKMISELSKSSTIYKYLIFIYSEQVTHSENENDHFDLDHLDHILAMCPAEKLMG